MKVALVTGGGKGLGRGFVEYLLNQDYFVFAGVRNPSSTELQKHDNLRIIVLDVTDDSSITNAVDAILKDVDHIDLLINNAGLNKDTATNNHKEIVCELPKLDRKLLLEMFNVNTISPIIITQKCLSLLQKTQESFVINISSNRASYHDEMENPSANYGYRASKTALNMITFCSALDLPKNIKTFAVHPGSIKSDMNPAGVNTPYDQAEQILAITTNWQEDFNGKFLRYDGDLYPL